MYMLVSVVLFFTVFDIAIVHLSVVYNLLVTSDRCGIYY